MDFWISQMPCFPKNIQRTFSTPIRPICLIKNLIEKSPRANNILFSHAYKKIQKNKIPNQRRAVA
ncbi:hypothetical protein CKA38_14940 [Ereboglobus luteus]|uniref:Uncharacterized protein n=1 Tax=Ereboglobus luteus TaxID=1796921 RepID=A0A2U8E615_9BACT|nr:hypothetical protein CKA38_14940 [Ereboglobus luteus]